MLLERDLGFPGQVLGQAGIGLRRRGGKKSVLKNRPNIFRELLWSSKIFWKFGNNTFFTLHPLQLCIERDAHYDSPRKRRRRRRRHIHIFCPKVVLWRRRGGDKIVLRMCNEFLDEFLWEREEDGAFPPPLYRMNEKEFSLLWICEIGRRRVFFKKKEDCIAHYKLRWT